VQGTTRHDAQQTQAGLSCAPGSRRTRGLLRLAAGTSWRGPASRRRPSTLRGARSSPARGGLRVPHCRMKVGWCDAAPTYREYDVTLRARHHAFEAALNRVSMKSGKPRQYRANRDMRKSLDSGTKRATEFACVPAAALERK